VISKEKGFYRTKVTGVLLHLSHFVYELGGETPKEDFENYK
jgi:hypothetical protein